jgi:hypothetical protein
MRPRGYFAVFRDGKVIRITHGHAEARSESPERAYRRFTDRTAAEEFAAWWNYDHKHWFEEPSTKE